MNTSVGPTIKVKVRGLRIELSDIESALLRQERVRDCVVVVDEDSGGSKRLVAYFVQKQKGSPSPEASGQICKGYCPSIWSPTCSWSSRAFSAHTQRQGRSRKALPKVMSVPDGRQYVAPRRTPTEQSIAQVWCEVLGIERVGVHDNFF